MKPILFYLGNFPIYGYGTMFGLAFIIGIFVAKARFKKNNISPDIAYDLAIVMLLSSLIGARIFFIIQYSDEFSFQIFNIFERLSYWGILPIIAIFIACFYNTKAITPLILACIACIFVKFHKLLQVEIGHFYILDFVFLVIACYYAFRNLKNFKEKFLTSYKITIIYIVGFLFFTVIMCRFLHCYLFWEWYDWEVFTFWKSGLVFYGGFIGMLISVWYYLYIKKVPMLKIMDLCIFAVALGLSCARLGCYWNGCCHGRTCSADFPLAVYYPTNSIAGEYNTTGISLSYMQKHYLPAEYQRPMPRTQILEALGKHMPLDLYAKIFKPVYPSQIFSSLNGLFLFLCVCLFYPFRKYNGEVLCFFCLLYGITRFFIEMLREEPFIIGGLTIAQVVSICVVCFFGAIFLWNRIKRIIPGPWQKYIHSTVLNA